MVVMEKVNGYHARILGLFVYNRAWSILNGFVHPGVLTRPTLILPNDIIAVLNKNQAPRCEAEGCSRAQTAKRANPSPTPAQGSCEAFFNFNI